ncbi:unnamed protein product [Paramecium primaurelia]|uniref:Uncharacterized protein n=1 Tax=Paramecium primaurelia TaxID=5886 RepID=A0A8S1Q1H3_PARPR|nr:unnamed protein product [Paramecium primaurelia]
MQKVYADQFNARMLNNDIKHWIIGFEGAKGTLYQREKFELQFKFSNEYVEVLDSYLALFSLKIANRITSSNINNQNIQVIFIGKTPELEHIYSVNQYYLMNGQLPQMYHLYVSQSNPCYQVLQKNETSK